MDTEVAMGFYERKILPKFLDVMMKTPENEKLRQEGLAPARGRLLEIGFGSGLNVAYYPKEVTSVVGIEPNPGMEKLARQRMSVATIPESSEVSTNCPLPESLRL